jgi:hypothetical protein
MQKHKERRITGEATWAPSMTGRPEGGTTSTAAVLKILLAVVIAEKNIFAAIAPLGEMMENSRDHYPAYSWHLAI